MANLTDLTVKIGADDSELGGDLKGAESKVSRFAKGLKATVAAAGAGAGVALAAGFAKNLELGEAQGKLTAQLGVTGERAKELGGIAASLYADAYGENIGQVNEALKSVIQSGAVMEDASSEQIESITGKVLDLATAFDQDVSGATAAVGQMMKTGLAPDADAALNIITRGFQQGVDKSGDFLDTLNEYGTQFRKVGLDGATATGLLSQGLKAGARDADLVADSIKEFSIRAIDGSKATGEGFKALGLDAADMAAKIAAGGPTASAALDLTLDKLRAMEDPVKRDAAAVALFGTQSEDLGAALLALDPSSAAQALGKVAGATDQVRDSLATSQEKITAMQRGVELWTASLVTAEGPIGAVATGIAAYGGQALGVIGPLGSMIAAQRAASAASSVAAATQATAATTTKTSWLLASASTIGSWIRMSVVATASALRIAAAWVLGVGLGAAAAVAGMVVASAMIVAKWVWMGAQAMFAAVRMAAAWFIALGPIGWVIAAVIGLVALIIANWDTVKRWTGAAWDWVVGKIDDAWNWIEGKVAQGVAFVMGRIEWFKQLPGRVGDWFGRMKDAAIIKLMNLVSWLGGLPGRALGAIGDLGSLLWSAGSDLVSGLWSGIKSMGSWLYSKIMGWIRSVVPGPILSFLGISSPSKWAEREVGRWIGPGLAEGIAAGSAPAERAASRLAAGVGAALGGGLSGSGRAAQQILDQLGRGGRVSEDFSFRGAGALVGKHNDAIAAAYRAAGGGDPRRFLQDYIAGQRIPASGGGQVPQVRLTADDALMAALLERLRKLLRDRGLAGVLG